MATTESLLEAAKEAAGRAYAPYSQFRVGAALECEDGSVCVGANVENRSFGLTCCAERSALFAAVSLGHRRFRSIAIYSPDSPAPLPPCGACRQVLSELAGPELAVLCFGADGAVQRLSLADLLPHDSLHDLRPARGHRRRS
jgi:cytidine deaminase